jgi:hypothetical protein
MLEAISFLVFTLVALVGPGIALQRLARVRIDPALVVPLGLGVVALSHWLSLRLDLPVVGPALVLLLDAFVLLPVGRAPLPWRPAPGPSLRGAVGPGVAVIALLAFTQYHGNRPTAEGEFLLDPFVAQDTAFHVGLVRELNVSFPPQVPGVSGFPCGYHFGTDLVRAAGFRWAAVDPYDSIARFDVTLFALALVLALRAAAGALGGGPGAVALAGFIPLLTDGSFLFAANPSAHWWADLLRGNLLVSLALANPLVPALALALGALVALRRHESGEGRGHLWLSAALAAAVPFFKVFLGAHLLLGLGAAWLLRPGKRVPIAFTALPCLLGTLLLVLGQGGETVALTLSPFDLAARTRETLGLPAVLGWPLLGWAVLWVGLSLGLRLLGLPHAARGFRGTSSTPAALAAMALSAWPLGLLFHVSAPEVLPGQRFVNDAGYLLEQGGPLLWLFTGTALARWARTSGRARTAVLLVLALATPATWQFVLKKAALPLDPVPAAYVRAVRAIEVASRPGDVVLQRPGARYPPLPVVLAGRRVPYERFTPYLTQFIPRADLEARHALVFRFFRTRDAEEARDIARSLGARFLCLYGSDRLRFPTAGVLEPVHEEPGARAFRFMAWDEGPPLRPGL